MSDDKIIPFSNDKKSVKIRNSSISGSITKYETTRDPNFDGVERSYGCLIVVIVDSLMFSLNELVLHEHRLHGANSDNDIYDKLYDGSPAFSALSSGLPIDPSCYIDPIDTIIGVIRILVNDDRLNLVRRLATGMAVWMEMDAKIDIMLAVVMKLIGLFSTAANSGFKALTCTLRFDDLKQNASAELPGKLIFDKDPASDTDAVSTFESDMLNLFCDDISLASIETFNMTIDLGLECGTKLYVESPTDESIIVSAVR